MSKKLLFISVISLFVLAACGTSNQISSTTADDSSSVQESASTQQKTVAEDSEELENSVRPAEAPTDLPSLDSAYDYEFYDAGSFLSFGYQVKGDLIPLCDELEGKLKDAGWTRSTTGMNSESDDNINRAFEKGSYKLAQGCSLTDGVPTFDLVRTAKKN